MFKRVAAFLLTSRARLVLLNCMRVGVRLEGISDEQPGIDQCRGLVKELTILKTRPATAGVDALGASSSNPDSDALGASLEPGAASAGSSGDPVVNTMAIAADAEVDPADEAATGETDMALS